MKKIVLIMAVLLTLTACTVQPKNETPGGGQGTSQPSKTEGKKIEPLPATIDMKTVKDANVAVAFNEKDLVTASSGTHSLYLTVYDHEVFDLVDISALAVGDTIVASKQEVKVETLEKNQSGLVIINGGIEKDGLNLATEENTVYFETGMNGVKSYFEVGQEAFNFAENFKFIDNSDLDKPNQEFTYDQFAEKLQKGEVSFDQFNTTALIVAGDIAEIEIKFIP